ncbi:LOW QUALITY PROTEIN: hypothetical protein YC2023_033139 [Brassica napus]
MIGFNFVKIRDWAVSRVSGRFGHLLRAILGIQVSTSKETCLKLPIDFSFFTIYRKRSHRDEVTMNSGQSSSANGRAESRGRSSSAVRRTGLVQLGERPKQFTLSILRHLGFHIIKSLPDIMTRVSLVKLTVSLNPMGFYVTHNLINNNPILFTTLLHPPPLIKKETTSSLQPAIVSDLPTYVKPSVLQVSNPFGTEAKDFHLQSDPQVRASTDSLAGFAAQDCAASQATTSVMAISEPRMFPEIFKDLSAREIQKLFPIQQVHIHVSGTPFLKSVLCQSEAKTMEAEGAEAKAKAAQAYTEEASKTLRGRNICKRH